MEKEYCLECGNENPPEKEVCECGGRNFVWGDDIILKDGKIICKCGNDKFNFSMHMLFTKFGNTTYVCSECGNVVGKQGWFGED
mgnify:FL=1|jgi:hypothetical protein